MKHSAINVESAEAFKQSVLDCVQFTPAMVADEVKAALSETHVNEGVPGSIWVFSGSENGVPKAWCDIDVCPAALADWRLRIAKCYLLLEKKGFHVEQFITPDFHRDLTRFQLVVRHHAKR